MIDPNDELNGEDLLNEQQPDRKKLIAFVVICVLISIAIGFGFWFHLFSPAEAKPKPQKNIAATTTPSQPRSQPVGRTFEFKEEEPAVKPTPTPVPETEEVKSEKKPEPPSEEKPRYRPPKKTIVLDKSGPSSKSRSEPSSPGGLGLAPRVQPQTQTTDGFNLFANDQDSSGLGSKLNATKTDKALAGVLYNRNYLLAKGAYIDCVLNTSLNSTVAGMTKCTLTRNIYSDNGTTLLLERGSEVTGEYRANLSQGQSRLFVLWDRVKTPRGIVIDLSSPATDSLGAGGVEGYIETHFWKRFGGAMMLSLIDDLAAYATSNGGNNSNNFDNSSNTAQSMAAEALKHTINIPPTFYKNQGERVGIFVARDLDFSTVYQLRAN